MTKPNRAERQARMTTEPEAKPPTRDDLYAQAKELGITGASKWNREQLAAAIADYTRKPEPTDPDEKHSLGEQRIAEAAAHYTETMADPDAPKPSDQPTDRSHLARKELDALKAWQLSGMKGDRPLTPNYDFISALYTGAVRGDGTTPRKRRAGGGTTRAKNGGPRGVEAAAVKDRCGGKRGKGVAISDDNLRAYIRKVHAEHPDSSRQDEREYAYWVEKLALTGRWPSFWKEVVAEDAPVAESPAVDDDDDVTGEDPDAIAAALAEVAQAGESIQAVQAAAKKHLAPPAEKVPAKKAPAKKTTGAKRGDNLRSTKQVTPITKEAQTRRGSKSKGK